MNSNSSPMEPGDEKPHPGPIRSRCGLGYATRQAGSGRPSTLTPAGWEVNTGEKNFALTLPSLLSRGA
jgi:hypothetical protein